MTAPIREAFEDWWFNPASADNSKRYKLNVDDMRQMAEDVTWKAWQEATRQAMERTLSICRQMEERGYDAKDCAEAIEDAMRALLPPTSPTSEESGNG